MICKLVTNWICSSENSEKFFLHGRCNLVWLAKDYHFLIESFVDNNLVHQSTNYSYCNDTMYGLVSSNMKGDDID